MVEDRPLGNWMSFLKGILGGSLISAGLFSLELGIPLQIIAIIIGLLIVIDAVVSKTEEIYPLSIFLGFIIGFFVALFCVVGKVAIYYTLLIVIVVALLYLKKLITRLKRR